MRSMKRTAILPLFLVAACSVPGTPQPAPVPAWFGTESDVDHVRRVMVLPFECAAGVQADTEVVREAFIAELSKLQRFELVPLPAGANADDPLYQGLGRGRISTEVLATLGERYKLDGVLFATATGYRPYKPPQLGLRIQLLSLHTATAVWAVEVFYDAADAGTVEDLKHYTHSFSAPEESLHGWEMNLISPRRFAAFVCHRVVGTWRDPEYTEAE